MKSILICAFICLSSLVLNGQSYYGSNFMDIGIGTRQNGLARSIAGSYDQAYHIFYNPGGLGFNRRFQVSADYTKWLAETSLYSFQWTGQKEYAGSRKSTLGVGLVTLGMPEWDSTDGLQASVSAQSLVFALSAAQRLDWLPLIGENISLGLSLKGVSSTLAQATAFGSFLDYGLMVRTGRTEVNWGVFKYLEILFGFAMQNAELLPLKFLNEKTTIPILKRYGFSLNCGTHEAYSFSISTALHQYEHFGNAVALGGEFWWRNLIGVRAGYESRRQVGGFSFSAGLRLGSRNLPLLLPIRSSRDLTADFSHSGSGDILNDVNRAGLSFFASGPEPFALIRPADHETLTGTQVNLSVQETSDPDPWDEISYYLIMDADKGHFDQAVNLARSNFTEFLTTYQPTSPDDMNSRSEELRSKLIICLQTDHPQSLNLDLSSDKFCSYYWTVMAVDLDHHVQVAHGSDYFRTIHLARPQLTVADIYLVYDPLIKGRSDDRQGDIYVKLINNGRVETPKYKLSVSIARLQNDREKDRLKNQLREGGAGKILGEKYIDPLSAGDSVIVKLDQSWRAPESEWGEYLAYARVEIDDANIHPDPDHIAQRKNEQFQPLFTVPRWQEEVVRIPQQDIFNVTTIQYTEIQIPVLPFVFFPANSAEISSTFIDTCHDQVHADSCSRFANLPLLAKRLNENQRFNDQPIKIKIEGFINSVPSKIKTVPIDSLLPFDDMNPSLAVNRAEEAKRVLVDIFHVDSSRITIVNNSADTGRVTMERAPLEQVSISDRSRSKLFSDWILAENRRVEISIDQPDQHTREMMEWMIFMPESVQVNRTISFDQPRFNINVLSFAPQSDHWRLEILDQNSDQAIKTFSLDDLKIWSDVKKAFEMNPSQSAPLKWDGWTDAGFEKLDKNYRCRFRLEEIIPHIANDLDTLYMRRTFATEPLSFSVFMKTEVLMNQIFSLYEYDESQPISDVVFGRNLIKPVLDKIEAYLIGNRQIRVRFLGHTDRIGTEEHNKTILSPKRADQLWNAFLKLARESNYPKEIMRMILNSKPDVNDYLGWEQPLRIQVDHQGKSEDVLLGDNETSIGRNYNRRSEVLIIEEK